MALSDILATLACESGLIEGDEGDVSEITIATSETMTELEECLVDLADDVEKAANSGNAAEKMIDVIESLESKVTMLRKMRDAGTNLNETAARIYADTLVTSFESRGFPAALYTGDVEKLVTSFESNTRYDYSTEAEKQTEGFIQKAKTMLSKALDTFIQWLKNMRSKMGSLNKTIGQLGQQLITRAKSIASNATTERKVKVTGLSLIGKGAGDVDAVSALDMLKTLSGKVATMETSLVNAIGTASTALATGNTESAKDAVKIPAGLAKLELSGGKSLEMDGTGHYKLTGTSPAVDGQVTPASGTEIALIGRKMVDLGLALDISEADAKGLISKLESSIDAVLKNLGEKGLSSSGGALKAFNMGLTSVRSLRAGLNTHAGQTAKQAYRYASMSANAY